MRTGLGTVATALLITALCTLAACRTPQRDRKVWTQYTDDIGRTVEVHVPASRIVTLAPNLTEIVFAAGASTHLAGVTTADDYPPEVDSLPRFSAVPIDFESIVGMSPDVVLATDQVNSPKDAATFESLQIPVYYFRFSTLDDIFHAIEVVGDLAGTKSRASSHSTTLQQALSDLRNRTDSLEVKPRVLFLIGDDKLFGFGRGSYVHQVIEAAGGVSVSAEEEIAAPVFSDEYVVEQRPDVIVGAFAPETNTSRLLELHPSWRTVPAIRNGKVYTINPDLILRPGPRVIEGAYRMALILHPGLFGSSAPASGR